MCSSSSTESLPFSIVEHNLKILAQCREGDKLISNEGKLSLETGCVAVTLRRAVEGAFDPCSIKQTFDSVLEITEKEGVLRPYLTKSGMKEKNQYDAIQSQFSPSLGGVLELIDTYIAESKPETVKKLEAFYEEAAPRLFTHLGSFKHSGSEAALPDYLVIHNIKLLSSAEINDKIVSINGRLIVEGKSSLQLEGVDIKLDSFACVVDKTYSGAIAILKGRDRAFNSERNSFGGRVEESLGKLKKIEEQNRSSGGDVKIARFLKAIYDRYMPQIGEPAKGGGKVSELIGRFGGRVKKSSASFVPANRAVALHNEKKENPCRTDVEKLAVDISQLTIKSDPVAPPPPPKAPVAASQLRRREGGSSRKTVHEKRRTEKQEIPLSSNDMSREIRSLIVDMERDAKDKGQGEKRTWKDAVNDIYNYLFNQKPGDRASGKYGFSKISEKYQGGKLDRSFKEKRRNREEAARRENSFMYNPRIDQVKMTLIEDYDGSSNDIHSSDSSWNDSPREKKVDSTLYAAERVGVVESAAGGANTLYASFEKGREVEKSGSLLNLITKSSEQVKKNEGGELQTRKQQKLQNSRSLYGGDFKGLEKMKERKEEEKKKSLEKARSEKEKLRRELRSKLESMKSCYASSEEIWSDHDSSSDEGFKEMSGPT